MVSVAAAGKTAPLVELANEADPCTTSKTIFLSIDPSGVRVLQCEGRPYRGPLSEAQHDTVVDLAQLLGGDGQLEGRERKRIQRYARVAARGANIAETDADAARMELTALVRILLRDVGVDRSGAFYLSSDFYTEEKSDEEVVRALEQVVEQGADAEVASLLEARPPGDYGPIGISSVEVSFGAPPDTATLTVTLYNFRDVLRSGACETDLDTFDSRCAINMVFDDDTWRLSRASFDALFGESADEPIGTTTTTVS
jgi:hypothetical protein